MRKMLMKSSFSIDDVARLCTCRNDVGEKVKRRSGQHSYKAGRKLKEAIIFLSLDVVSLNTNYNQSEVNSGIGNRNG